MRIPPPPTPIFMALTAVTTSLALMRLLHYLGFQ
jgi:hypothetical protein